MISRRTVIGAAGQLATVSYLGKAFAGSVQGFILGYTDKNTYFPGESVRIRMNPCVDTRAVGSIYPNAVTTGWKLLRNSDGAVMMSGVVTIQPSVIAPANQDQQWPLTLELQLPSNLRGGVYHFRCDESTYQVGVYFCVRPLVKSEMIVILPTNTFQAYNYYGGKSMYVYNSSNSISETKVSFNRPMGIPFYGALDDGLNNLLNWLTSKFSCDIATDRDLHNDSSLLQGYKCVIPVHHSEYWSRTMRDNLQNYLMAGGNIANFSGNTIWWCVRYEDNGTSMYCARSTDPRVDPNPDAAILWHMKGWSAKNQLGCGFEDGAAATDTANPLVPASAKVYRANHWIYYNTNVVNGGVIGVQESVATYEVDGVTLDWFGEGPRLRSGTGTDSSFVILAACSVDSWTPSPPKNWTIGYLNSPYGGKIFNAATVNWYKAFKSNFTSLASPSPLVTMTFNFLNACTNMQLIEFRTPNPVKDPLDPNAVNGYMYMYLTETAIAQLRPSIQNNIRSVYTANANWTESGARLTLPLSYRPGAVPLYKHSMAIKLPGSRFTLYKEILSKSSTVQNASWRNEGVIGYVFDTNVAGSKPAYLFTDTNVPGGSERLSVVNSRIGREAYSGVKFYCY